MTAKEEERRRYFRVNDLIGVRYRFLSDNETELAVQAQPSSLRSMLAKMNEEITIALAKLKNTKSEVYTLLDLYNQKINLAFGHGFVENDDDDAESMKACQVNLSACGIAFPCAEAASLNQHIELELSLYQSNVNLRLVAAVIACDDYLDPVNNNAYFVRADFVNLSDVDQELLIQYVIKRQTQQLKELRIK